MRVDCRGAAAPARRSGSGRAALAAVAASLASLAASAQEPAAGPQAAAAETPAPPGRSQLGGSDRDAPIEIMADQTQMESARNIIRGIGRVHVRQGDAEIRADRMDVYFYPSAEGSGDQRRIERIVAEGSVIYTTPFETARADHGVYTAADERIRLTSRVRLLRGPDVLCGEELVIHPRIGQVEAKGGGKDPLCPGRVRAVISPGTASSAP